MNTLIRRELLILAVKNAYGTFRDAPIQRGSRQDSVLDIFHKWLPS
ncbi:hypothetical protein [Desulfosporosinus fructosivorans]|nr:hypothetical protein [Desulfosporosinus fructosivorans]